MSASSFAKALAKSAKSQKELLHWNAVLTEFVGLQKDLPLFSRFLLQPRTTQEEKLQILNQCVEDKTLAHFLLLVIRKKKWSLLSRIAADFHSLVVQSLEKEEATVISARPLATSIFNEMSSFAEKYTEKPVLLSAQVDERLIGGFVLIIGHKILDKSIKGELTRMKMGLLFGENAC